MAIIGMVGGIDISVYLKGLDLTPGGDGIVGSGKLYLDQEAGGLDIRTMDLVQVWVPHTGSAGVATKGRLLGGHVNVRDTGNIGTTKTWSLNIWDHNILLHKIVRDRQAAKAVVLTADTFGAQIADLISIIQTNGGGSVRTAIEATFRVADLYPTMPAVTYPGGKKLGWYIQQLCDTVHLLDDAVFPRFYMGTSVSYGIGEIFDTPYLVVYDGALLPSPALSFSDVVAGGRKPIFGTFKRVTDATAMSQRRQSRFGNDVIVTSENNVSQAAYSCEYINHAQDPGGNSGFWMNETFEDSESVSFAEAQARIDAIVAAESNPRDTFEFETPERVLPGETIGLGWTLESIPDDTEYTVAKVQIKIEPPDVLWSKLTVNARRLGLFDGNLSVFAAPIEGDANPPLPPSTASVTGNAYNPALRLAELSLTIGASPSPDAAGYVVEGTLSGLPYEQDVGTDLTPVLLLYPDTVYSLRVKAYDNQGNRSDPFPAVADPALTGTTASIEGPPAPTISGITGGVDTGGKGYAKVTVAHGGAPTGGGWVYTSAVGPGIDRPPVRIRPGVTFPVEVTVPNLSILVPYEFTASVLDAYDNESEQSAPENYTVIPVPGPDPPEWDEEPPDSDDRGQEILTNNSVVRSWETDPDHLFAGLTTRKMFISIGSDGDELGLPFSVRPEERGTLIITRKGSETGAGPFVGVPMASAHLRWYDETYNLVGHANYGDPDSHIQEDEIFDDSLPADFAAGFVEYGWEAPLLARMGRVRIRAYETTGIGDGEWDVWFAFASPPIKREVTEPQLADEAVSDRTLGILTDPTKHEYDIETNSLKFKDASGNYRSQIVYDNSSDFIRFLSANSTSETSMEVGTTNVRMEIIDSGGAPGLVRFKGDASIVPRVTELSTADTDGDFYVPTVNGIPTGVPASFTGVVAMRWDRANQKLYVYDGGSWRLISTGGTVTGTGANTRVALWSGTSTQTSDAGITYDTSTDRLTVLGGISLGGQLLTAIANNQFTSATDSAAYGTIAIGDTTWDFATAGRFALVGSASGTQLAINPASGYAGDLIHAAVFGVSKFKVSSGGAVTTAGNVGVGGAVAAEVLKVYGTSKFTGVLTVDVGANFGGDMAVDASGGTSGTPRVLGLTNLGYARLQIGDAFTSLQSHNGGRMVIQGYHGLSIWGARATTGSVQGFEAGGGGADPSVRIYGSQSGTKVAAIQGASGQTANLLDFENSSGTVLSGISSAGAFKFGTNQVVGARKTGWGLPTGTLYRTALTDASTQAQFNQALMALLTDLHATAGHGLIGT